MNISNIWEKMVLKGSKNLRNPNFGDISNNNVWNENNLIFNYRKVNVSNLWEKIVLKGNKNSQNPNFGDISYRRDFAMKITIVNYQISRNPLIKFENLLIDLLLH